jgi:hypothetical protein
MKKLVISEKKWLSGEYLKKYRNSPSKLLNRQETRMCCLGFAAIQLCGANPRDIKNKACPEDVAEIFQKKLPWLLKENGSDSPVGLKLMKENDNTDIDMNTRKSRIAALFAEHGVKVVFVP